MLRIFGVPVAAEAAGLLVDLLVASGHEPAAAAAREITVGLNSARHPLVPLTVGQRDAVLAVMPMPLAGLEELHKKLVLDRAARLPFAA